MFITQALADTTETVATGQNSIWQMLQNIAPLLIIMVIFYFLVIRPQQKKLRDHQNMVNNLKKGDKVVTAGGIIGTISKVEAQDGVLLVEIAPEVKVKIKKETVSRIMDAEKTN
ncbi:preprotein translocase subunit YajC [Candidatus Bandiella euplotis]|uniref:Sec translocon accessory complex subunit YajC n=1 Tax=Candidatus Bandiella euplotis TaxID=1664265 RepID=A0ABZ0UQE6_9RICK|nr:preprotein translocase subunit YajC [Candidatus Bandiella woodruffii]WPX96928.1 Preprotein translocase subunit YajC [Candidatus Bandiella woodruffii]